VLEPLALESNESDYIRRCNILVFEGVNQVDKKELWFEFSKSVNPPKDKDCDSYLLAAIMDAMKENTNITVKGSVSRQLLSNLIEFQSIWKKWLPHIYHLIDITVDCIRDDSSKVPGAICAFSGGVDATFSVWRHSQSKCSYRSQKINLCSIVHGFDIRLNEQVAFNNARNTAQKTLDDIDINLLPIKTNYRKISRVDWDHSHACALVATLSNFKNMAGTCIVGSTDPYDAIYSPWGSSPITDHLFSSDEFFVIHDGASHSRTEKVKEITEWQVGDENLRVCSKGDTKEGNCGICEKCVRTRLNHLAIQAPIPKCFPNSNINIDIKKVRLSSDAIRTEWQQIYQYAINNGIDEAWVKKIKSLINKKSVIDIILPKGSPRRGIVKNLVSKLRGRGS